MVDILAKAFAKNSFCKTFVNLELLFSVTFCPDCDQVWRTCSELFGSERCKKHVDLVDLVTSFSNAYFLAKLGVDTEESEPSKGLIIWPNTSETASIFRTFQLGGTPLRACCH